MKRGEARDAFGRHADAQLPRPEDLVEIPSGDAVLEVRVGDAENPAGILAADDVDEIVGVEGTAVEEADCPLEVERIYPRVDLCNCSYRKFGFFLHSFLPLLKLPSRPCLTLFSPHMVP